MTISSDTRQAGPYDGNGVTTAFPFAFKVFTTADVQVVQTDLDGVETTLTLTTHYTVSLNADQNANPGGTVTAVSAPATGYKWTITSQIAPRQSVDLTNLGGFYPSVINAALDKLTILVQQLTNSVERAIKLPISDNDTDTTIAAASLRQSAVLGFDSSGKVFVYHMTDMPTTAVSPFFLTLADDTTALAARTTLGAAEGGRGAGTSTPVEGLTDSNTAVGLNALVSNVDGYENTAVGVHALRLNTTGTENNAFGTLALESNTIGTENVGVGVRALWKNVDGNDNTAVGHAAMNANVSGDDNVAIGQTALYRLTGGDRNTAVGRQALEYLLTGTDNTAVGHSALDQCTGSTNTAVGRIAGYGTTSGSGNVYVGYSAASGNQTGNFNCIVGYQAMNVATAASNCVYMGYQAGYVSTGNNNTGVGNQAMLANVGGTDNTALGILSLSANTSGSGNVGIGNLANSSNQTGSHNTAVGMSAFTSGTAYSNSSCFGYNAQVSGSNQVQLGDSSTTTYVYGTVQNRSDARDKADVRDTVLGLDFVNALRPVDFRWAYREDGGQVRTRYHHGLIAQEVEATGAEFGGLQHHSVAGGADVYTIGYDELIGPLIKAVQELTVQNAALLERVAALEAGG